MTCLPPVVPPGGCIADYEASADLINRMKKAQILTVQAIHMNGQAMSPQLDMKDFAKAYDGPPTDPKVFEEQQKKLQDELQKRAEEARKKLESQPPQAAAPGAPAGSLEIDRTKTKARREAGLLLLRAANAISSASRCAACSRRCHRARTPRAPADGGPVCPTCRATGSAPRHRRRIRFRRSRRTDDRTAGLLLGRTFSGIDSHHSSVLLNTGSMSKMTPRNGNTRCFTTSPILNRARRLLEGLSNSFLIVVLAMWRPI